MNQPAAPQTPQLPPSPPSPARPGSFSHVIGLFVPALRLCWRNLRTIIAVSLLLPLASIVWEFFSAAIAPDYSVSALLAEYGVDPDELAGQGEPELAPADDALTGQPEQNPEAAFAEALTEAMGPEAQQPPFAPIYGILSFIGTVLIGLASLIAAYFVIGQSMLQERRVEIGETLEAIRTCPARFYIAVGKKWLYLGLLALGPVLLGVALFAAGEPVGYMLGGFLILCAIVYVFYLTLKWMLIEPIVLFEELRFNAAREESGRLMKGSKRSFFFANLLLSIAVMAIIMVVTMLLVLPGLMLAVGGALFSPVLAVLATLLILIPWMVLLYMPSFFFVALILLVWDALRKAYGPPQ